MDRKSRRSIERAMETTDTWDSHVRDAEEERSVGPTQYGYFNILPNANELPDEGVRFATVIIDGDVTHPMSVLNHLDKNGFIAGEDNQNQDVAFKFLGTVASSKFSNKLELLFEDLNHSASA